MDLPMRRMLLDAFFLCQFSYCPLVLMVHSRGKHNKINRLRERCLQIIYSNKKSTFIELLKIDFASIHKKNLRLLAIEVFKFKIGLVLVLCKEMVPQNRQNRYESRNNADFTFPSVKSNRKGLESLS